MQVCTRKKIAGIGGVCDVAVKKRLENIACSNVNRRENCGGLNLTHIVADWGMDSFREVRCRVVEMGKIRWSCFVLGAGKCV